ncbi:TPA: hypothetical protein SAY52_000398 [Burkholderia cenocepacia]|uniref:hypothetical protein n=1 Tax=unclassified Burkholderia TaxID=2613784 RepID=UPI00158E99E9|nr:MULTISPECIES: hypothetical protein [unclassified Burkholderia]HEF5869842.1 hypothetical protein [Burkholderia cenocepacia]
MACAQAMQAMQANSSRTSRTEQRKDVDFMRSGASSGEAGKDRAHTACEDEMRKVKNGKSKEKEEAHTRHARYAPPEPRALIDDRYRGSA